MRRFRGFSLFEVMLALIVMSLIVVGGIAWSKRKQQETSAEQLGHRLYLYGMAVTEYGRQNPDGYHSGKLPPANLYGFEWLKNTPNKEMCADINNDATCDMFLEQDFNFKFNAVVISSLIEGNDDAQVEVIYETPLSTTPGPLKVKEVRVGKVYVFSQNGGNYEVNISLDARATSVANHFHDQHGTAEITYKLSSMDKTALITGVPTTMGINVDAAYLRTDGANEMDNSIRFSNTATMRDIEQVGTINFKNQRKAEFSGMTLITPPDCNVNNSKCTLVQATKDAQGNSTNVCFLSQTTYREPENNHGGDHYGCKIVTESGNWVMYNKNLGGHDNRNTCSAICLSWGP